VLSELVLDILLEEVGLLLVASETSLSVNSFDCSLQDFSVQLDSLSLFLEELFCSFVDNNVLFESFILKLVSSLFEISLLFSLRCSISIFRWSSNIFEFSETSALASFFIFGLLFSSTEEIDKVFFNELLSEFFALDKTVSLILIELLFILFDFKSSFSSFILCKGTSDFFIVDLDFESESFELELVGVLMPGTFSFSAEIDLTSSGGKMSFEVFCKIFVSFS